LLPAASTATAGSERLRWVRASQGERMQQIAVDEVLYFHADDKYTCVRTAQAEYLIRTPIAELAAQLDPAVFCQVHRSTIVNLRHLEGTRRDEASRLFARIKGLPAGAVQELPVSRAYVHLFKAM
jgi:DNA-binding LytR/AlgR family response regulator